MSIKYFETIKCEDFEIFNLEYHERRIAKTIGLNLNLQEYIYPPNSELLRCKLIYDESGILSVDFYPYKKRVIETFKILYDDCIDYSSKYLNRTCLDELFELKEDCDEIIIVKNGIVTDTSIANIAVYYQKQWFISKDSLLEGTTKSRLIKERNLIEKNITVEMLKKSEKIALLNAMIDFDVIENYSLRT